MSDLVIYLTLSISALIVILLALTLWQGKKRSKRSDDDDGEGEGEQLRRRPVPVRGDDGPRIRQRQRHRVPIAPRIETQNVQDQFNDDDDGADDLGDDIELPEGKIGAKKRKKLEAKAEKRAQRERDLEERAERKERDAKIEEQRRKEEEKLKAEEKQKEEDERKAREEKERQEHEEYLKLKESFAIEEEGFDDETDETETQNKLQTFIDYIKTQKVVLMEDLAARFQMKTQDVIARVQDLLAQELIVGVIDDRGKFIYITREELESVAKFIRQRGRVSIVELVECSNSLINLTPEVTS